VRSRSRWVWVQGGDGSGGGSDGRWWRHAPRACEREARAACGGCACDDRGVYGGDNGV